MVFKWIAGYLYILGFRILILNLSQATELVEQIFIQDTHNKTSKPDILINNHIRNDTLVGKVRESDDRTPSQNDLNILTSTYDESSRFVVNPLVDNVLGIKINLFISDVKTDAVKISWKADTFQNQMNFGLKVSFRSFGSSIEREVIFLVESSRGMSNELNYYEVNGLTSNTGYVFCFSIIEENLVNEVLKSDEYKHVTTKESNSTTTEGIQFDAASANGKTSTTAKLMTTAEENNIAFETTTNSQHSSTTTTIIPESTSRPTNVANQRGSYVYTSTGELIFLPTSAWKPFRRKRSTGTGTSRITFQNSFKKVSSNNRVQCTEIFTATASIFGAGNFVIIFTILVIIVCIVVLLLMICCINKLLCKVSILQSLKKFTLGIKNSRKQEAEVIDVSSAVTYVRDGSFGSRRDSLEESTDVESRLPPCICKSSSLPSYHEILLRHEAGTLKKQKSTDIFHPGYAIPPSSKNEAYGYDIPKLSNKQINYSCNDGFSWKDKEIYNWNCHAQRKKSAYASKNVPRLQDIFPSKPSSSELVFTPEVVQTYPDKLKVWSNDEEPSITSVNSIDSHYEIPYISRNKSEKYSSSRRKSSIGDITITGGTLIEVPEGYVVPDRSKGLRLVVTGTPVYL